jgi:hypothetical protein
VTLTVRTRFRHRLVAVDRSGAVAPAEGAPEPRRRSGRERGSERRLFAISIREYHVIDRVLSRVSGVAFRSF